MKEKQATAKTTAVIWNREDGTHTVYQCFDKEEPAGYRRIKRKFLGFKPRSKALEFADHIKGIR